ncbi:hypothetical protein [Thermosediminibacter oceani]|uniref:Uncharacterized protein n=1 Tax=Thermosediminibacter oceani (strain ATCC BAA-1034 / DSM 16646 / JW/IW-1228P) TaxID=555079 RepID=D9S1I5_THEOJ|nr:hypothetical protein [Thermosediminibacter oceani]ADL07262.1 conserved hypothetical protein [Thermosediminibacter oceani DSM 16646]
MSKFEEIRKEIEKSGKTPESLGQIFSKFGLTPDNPEFAKELLREAGLDVDLTPEKAAETVKKMTEKIPPELKKQMAELMLEVSKYIPAGPMPEDVKNFLLSWKGEEKDKET